MIGAPTPGGPPSRSVEVAVIGAGPAGRAAALVLARAGVDVLLLDKAAIAPPSKALGEEAVSANTLVWSVLRTPTGFRLDLLSPAGPDAVEARVVLAAIGAVERIVPFPGWRLPGVLGLSATTAALRKGQPPPGSRVVVAGAGPSPHALALDIRQAGAKIAALADLAGTRDWLSARPHRAALAALLGGLAAGARLRTGVRRVEGRDRVERVVLGAVDAAGAPLPGRREWAVAADALVVGHGTAPATEITRLLRAEHVFARALGGWCPRLDETGQTSVPGLWVAGDAGGVLGPKAAALTGARAGAAIAHTLGHAAPAPIKANRVLQRARALARLSAQHPAMTAAIPPDTLVCPDEGLSRAEIEAAIDDGAHDLNQLKHFTRCAMGPRQGRDCGDVVAELLALRLVALGRAPDIDTARRTAGQWTGRVPLRPLPLAAMIGAFDYTDIPVPEPAPL